MKKLDFTKLAPVPSGYKILRSREVHVEGEKWENRLVINDFNMMSKKWDWLATMVPKICSRVGGTHQRKRLILPSQQQN